MTLRQDVVAAVRSTTASQRVLGGFFVSMGMLHFVVPQVFDDIVPDYLPAHRALTLLSGAAEIAGGLGVLHPRTRRAAGWGLQVLLVSVFPANLDMAVHAEEHSQIPPALLWARLPLQPLAMWWVYRATLRRG